MPDCIEDFKCLRKNKQCLGYACREAVVDCEHFTKCSKCINYNCNTRKARIEWEYPKDYDADYDANIYRITGHMFQATVFAYIKNNIGTDGLPFYKQDGRYVYFKINKCAIERNFLCFQASTFGTALNSLINYGFISRIEDDERPLYKIYI